jgi:hypothetical protein
MNSIIRQVQKCLDEQSFNGPGKASLVALNLNSSLVTIRFLKARVADPDLTEADRTALTNKIRTIYNFEHVNFV